MKTSKIDERCLALHPYMSILAWRREIFVKFSYSQFAPLMKYA